MSSVVSLKSRMSVVNPWLSKRSKAFATLLALPLIFSGCTKKSEEAKKEREVSLAIWANYISPEVQEKFTKQTGIKLKISNYSSNEELQAKIQAGASGIDVAVPSDYMVEIMAKQDMLLPIDSAKVPNTSGLDPAVMKQEFDPENKFSLPYAWTTAGIAVNRELFKGSIKGWKDLLNNPELAGKISLLDDYREVMAAALRATGKSVNTDVVDDLKPAQALLKASRTRVKMFSSDTIDALVNKEVAVAQAYSSDALQASEKSGGKIEFVLPEEGGTKAIDNLVILKGAKNVEEAHILINYLLSADANVEFVKAIRGGPVVKAAKDKLPPELQSNSSLFPSEAALAKFERIRDLEKTNQVYERLWTELKAE